MTETLSATENFTAWVAVLDGYAANLDAIVSGELEARRFISTDGLGALPRSLEVRATDLLTRTMNCEREVEERMHEIRQRKKLAGKMKQNMVASRFNVLDASY